MAEYLEVPTPDGRILEVLTEGDPDGYPLLYHSGTPSGAVPFPTLDRAATAQGMRVVTYSRPGYGDSTPWPFTELGPRIADDVVDVLAILHHVGIDEFVTVGWSGGGPRSLACAAILPGRCLAAATLAGVAPYDAYGLDWEAGMADENVEEFAAAVQGASTYHQFLRRQEGPEEDTTPADLVESLGGLLTPIDAGALTGDFAAYLLGSMRKAREQGVVGWRDDGLSIVGAWGFAVGAITTPTSVWHGRQDAMVPFAHGEWLAAHVPGARSHLFDDQGHLSLWSQVDPILAELKELAGV
jgi:pimeloyl-ACP methyl ester carboxylesterase